MPADQPHVVANRRVLRNTLSNYIGKFANLGIWFFLTPFILSQLGPAMYGLWVLVGSLVAYGSLFDFGIASAITKYTAEYQAKQEYEQGRKLVATALTLYTILGLTVILIAVLIAPLVPAFFNIAEEQHSTAVALVIISGIGVGLSIPCTAAPAVLGGLQRFDLINIINISGALLSAAVIIGVLSTGGNVVALVAATILVNLLMQIPSIWLIGRIAPELQFGWRGTSRRLIRKVTSFSVYLFILNLNGYLETKTDELVIGASLSAAAVAPYNIALKLTSIPQMLTAQFVSQILPLASTLDAQHNLAQIRSLYIMSTRLTLALFLPVGMLITVLAEPILSLWVGTGYANYAYLVVILTLASFIDTSQWPAGLILQGMSRHRLLALASLSSGLSNLVLSIVLVRIFGLAGVALGTLIPTTLVTFGFVLPYSIRLIGVSLREMIVDSFAPAFIPAIPMLITVLILKNLVGIPTFFSLLLIMGLSVVVYGSAYLALKINAVERRAFFTLVASLFRYVQIRLNAP